jgi:hypothetical protein
MFLMTEFMNFKINPAQFFENTHKDSVYTCVYRSKYSYCVKKSQAPSFAVHAFSAVCTCPRSADAVKGCHRPTLLGLPLSNEKLRRLSALFCLPRSLRSRTGSIWRGGMERRPNSTYAQARTVLVNFITKENPVRVNARGS